MKKRLIASVVLLIMLLQCACAAMPASHYTADNIISSCDVVKTSESVDSVILDIAATEIISLRGGSWGDKTWRQIMDERKAQGQIKEDFIVIKNGLKDSDYTRVALLKFDISEITAKNVEQASFDITFTHLQPDQDIYFDVYWVDENWSSDTVTWKTRPAFIKSEPILKNVLTTDEEKIDATDAMKELAASGKREIALMVAQVTSAADESRIAVNGLTELSVPRFTVVKNNLTDDEGDSAAIEKDQEMNNEIRNITVIEKLSLRGGSWGDMTWRQIMDKRKASDELGEDFIVIKNGLKDSAYTRVGLFKYDISDLSLDDIGYATFGMTFTALQNDADIYFDIYWVDENWSADTVTWKTKPAFVMEEPLIKNVLTTTVAKTEATDALKTLVESGKKEVALLVAQVTSAAAESRISIAKSNDLSFPHFTVYSDSQAKGDSYIKQLVENEAENQAIWDHAKKMFDEWYADYNALKDKPLYDAEMIVSDESQYNKTSITYPNRPLEGSKAKEHKTRTFADLKDFSELNDVKLDRYGGIIDPTLRQDATGFFYTTKINGRWWVIDPLGNPCHIQGVHSITYSYDGSEKQKNAALAQFGTLEKWAVSTTRHLIDDLGFNTGAGFASEIAEVKQGIIKQGGAGSFMSAYAKSLGVNNSNGGSTTFSENNTMPVFDPNFESFCEERAATKVAPLANDRDFLGYTTDNELPMQETMLLDYMKLSPVKEVNHYSYACAWYWMVQMTGKDNPTDADITDELKELFRGFVWRRYYDVVCGAVRKYDPNHMLLGTRFLTAVKDAPWVLRFAGEYLDCITINWYGAWQPEAEDIYTIATHTDVPFMVTEFYAKGQENEGGLKNTTGAGWIVKTQKDRGEFYQCFTLRLLEAKNCIGWHWYQYTDNDPSGKASDTSGTDSNKGLVSNTHKEYKELTSHMAEINKNVYSLINYFDAK